MIEPLIATYVDITLVAIALFAVIGWLKRARAGLAVVGALLLGAVYLAAREFQLELTAWAFQGLFAVFVIVLIVVLQNDLRRLFERVAILGVRSAGGGRTSSAGVDALCEIAFELAGRRCGALIVLPGRDPLERHADGGVRLDGKLSRPLMLSLFDPGSIGHDGAVIVDGGLVTQFAVHLPLSANFREIQSRGTRHSAAVGLSELTDALCVAVSEERGEVSVARAGRLEIVESIDHLKTRLRRFLEERDPGGSRPSRVIASVRKNWADAALAVVLALGLWQLFASGAVAGQRTVSVPVLVDNIDPRYEVEAVDPARVDVQLSGLRRDLFLLDPTAIEVRLDAALVASGRRTFRLSSDSVRHPPDITVRGLTPDDVVLSVRSVAVAQPPAQAADAPSR